jgi:hypothetical protein
MLGKDLLILPHGFSAGFIPMYWILLKVSRAFRILGKGWELDSGFSLLDGTRDVPDTE